MAARSEAEAHYPLGLQKPRLEGRGSLLKATAEQWTDDDRLRAILAHALATFILTIASPPPWRSHDLVTPDTLTAVVRVIASRSRGHFISFVP